MCKRITWGLCTFASTFFSLKKRLVLLADVWGSIPQLANVHAPVFAKCFLLSSVISLSMRRMANLDEAFPQDVLAMAMLHAPGSAPPPYYPGSYAGGSNDMRLWPLARSYQPGGATSHSHCSRQPSVSYSEMRGSVYSLITLRDIFVDRKRIQFGCKIMEGTVSCLLLCTLFCYCVQW